LSAQLSQLQGDEPETLIGPNGTCRDSILDRHKAYLQQRCADGVTGTNQLLDEIRARGYRGSERTLRRYLIGVRGRNEPTPVPPPVPPTRDITGWIRRPVDNLTDDDRAELQRLCGLCPGLAAIRDLARGFVDLVRTRGGERLNPCVEQAEQGAIQEIRSFANGLGRRHERPDHDLELRRRRGRREPLLKCSSGRCTAESTQTSSTVASASPTEIDQLRSSRSCQSHLCVSAGTNGSR
jgi:hypothetical protein